MVAKGMKWTAAGKNCTQSRDLRRQDFTFAYKKVIKGTKQAAAGKIYTQSRNSHRQDFTFAYKKGYKRNEMDCGRGDLYAVSRFAPSGFHICV